MQHIENTSLHFTVSESIDHAHRRWGHDQPLTDEMQAFMQTVAAGLDSGIFYTIDMYAYVCSRYAFTEEELSRGKGKVEGGVVGMDIYYARGRVEHQRKIAADAAARARLNLTIGQPLGTLKFNTKTYRNCSVAEITDTQIRLLGTRGNQRYNFITMATAIENALNTQRASV